MRTPHDTLSPAYEALNNPLARRYGGDVAAYLLGRDAIQEWNSGVREETSSPSRIASHETGHAVVMAACGDVPRLAEVFQVEGQFAGAVWMPEGAVIEFSSLPAIVGLMMVSASGYVGERHWGWRTFSCSAHEVGLLLYLCQLAEVHYGYSARSALLATLSECRAILEANRATAEALRDRLIADRYLAGDDLAKLLPVERWEQRAWIRAAERAEDAGDYAHDLAALAVAQAFARVSEVIYREMPE